MRIGILVAFKACQACLCMVQSLDLPFYRTKKKMLHSHADTTE